jgi:hypothetical protein
MYLKRCLELPRLTPISWRLHDTRTPDLLRILITTDTS